MNRSGGALFAAAGIMLLLAAVTGALHSPALLLVPIPLLLAALRLGEREAYAFLPLCVLLLVAAEGMTDALSRWELGAAVAAAAMLVMLAWLVRRWLREGTAADRAGVRLPAPAAVRPGSDAAELERQVEQIRAWSGAAAVVLWEVAASRARPLAAAGRTPPPVLGVEGNPLGWVAREGTPLRLERAAWMAEGASTIAARVHAAEDVAWLLTYEYGSGAHPPTHEELASYAAPLGGLLTALAVRRDAAAGQQRIDALLELLRRIPLEIDLAAYGRELLQAALALTGGTGGCVGTWSGERGEVFSRVGSDGGPQPGAAYSAPHSELALAIRAGAPIIREGGRWKPGDTQVAQVSDEWVARPRVLVSLPLLTPSRAVGALALWSSRSAGFDRRALDLLEAVLPYAALHLDHALAYGRLRETADRDPLTGLRNRRAFEETFAAERQRFERYNRPLALLLIDIDHFKAINDGHGHEAGDQVLRAVAGTLQAAVRDVDIPARFGGEEFVVLLPECDLAAAADVAERVRSAVERAPFAAGGRPIEVRVSVGVAACPEQATTPESLLGSADGALYEAKRSGRNQVRLAGAGPRR